MVSQRWPAFPDLLPAGSGDDPSYQISGTPHLVLADHHQLAGVFSI
jgi:hypothetical protein